MFEKNSQTFVGLRGVDDNSMNGNGNAIMYDAVAGRILTLEGSRDYAGSRSTSNAHQIIIDALDKPVSALVLKSMHTPRMYHISVVLPDGTVFVTGGQTMGASFTDFNSVLTPELFNPAGNTFIELAANVIPRNYHSVSLLLLDGTVFNEGGDLCGDCIYNHFDAQIYTPQYLLNGDARPVIKSVFKAVVAVGGTFTATIDIAVSKWSLIRYGSVIHIINIDQRRILLTPGPSNGSLTYRFKLPGDSGIVLPGYYMLFALNSKGTPSVAKTIRVSL